MLYLPISSERPAMVPTAQMFLSKHPMFSCLASDASATAVEWRRMVADRGPERNEGGASA
jgi:hypothetical protein